MLSQEKQTLNWLAVLADRTVVNFVGAHDGLEYRGRSALYGPDGRLLADAGPDRTGIAVADFDPEKLRRTRETLRMLRDRREEHRSVEKIVTTPAS